MDSTRIYYACLSTADFLRRQTTSFSETTWIEGNSLLKLFVYFWHTKLNTPKTSSFSEETTSVPASTVFTDSTMNVSNLLPSEIICLMTSIRKCYRYACMFISLQIVSFFLAGKRRYNIKLWKIFTDCFNCLPIAAIVDEKIFCCHGGEHLMFSNVSCSTKLVFILPIKYDNGSCDKAPCCAKQFCESAGDAMSVWFV